MMIACALGAEPTGTRRNTTDAHRTLAFIPTDSRRNTMDETCFYDDRPVYMYELCEDCFSEADRKSVV